MMAIRDHPMAADTMGIDTAPLQDGDLRHQRRLHRHRRRPVGLGDRLRGARQLQLLPVDQVPDRPGGGRRRLAGRARVVGGIFYVLVDNSAQALSTFVKNDLGLPFDLSAYTVFGILLIVLMYLMPMGIVGGVYMLPCGSCAAAARWAASGVAPEPAASRRPAD